jgi:ribosome-binding factor A
MNSIKLSRYNSLFVKEISNIIQNEVKDKDIKFVTITGCEITNDLSFAKVYYTVLDESKKNDTRKALDKAKGFIRGEISKRVDIRHTPELRFVFDESTEYGTNIDRLLKEIHDKDNNK